MVQPESMDVFPRKERRHFIRTFPPSCREGDRPVLCVVQLVQYKNAHRVQYVVFADLDMFPSATLAFFGDQGKCGKMRPPSKIFQSNPYHRVGSLSSRCKCHSEPSQCEFHLDKDWPSHLKFHQKVPLLLCQVRPIGWQAFWGGTGRTVGWLGSWF